MTTSCLSTKKSSSLLANNISSSAASSRSESRDPTRSSIPSKSPRRYATSPCLGCSILRDDRSLRLGKKCPPRASPCGVCVFTSKIFKASLTTKVEWELKEEKIVESTALWFSKSRVSATCAEGLRITSHLAPRTRLSSKILCDDNIQTIPVLSSILFLPREKRCPSLSYV